jgi:hypothetical protein
VLSNGKLARGQARYYLQQAQARVNRPRSVASGIEDYYLGGPEAAGTWMGSLAQVLAFALPVKGWTSPASMDTGLLGDLGGGG